MSMRRWDPFRDLNAIQHEINRLFGRYGTESSDVGSRAAWSPELDIYETQDKFSVVLELPGMTTEDVDITVEDGVLTVSGERKFYNEVNEESFHRIERRFGSFARRITLPQQLDAGKISASMVEGILTIEVPKSEQAKPRRIEVKATKGNGS